MLAQLSRTLEKCHCDSFTDLIDKLELRDWNVSNKDFWSHLRKSLQNSKVSHIHRTNGQKNRLSGRPWKGELGDGNAVHPEVQDTN